MSKEALRARRRSEILDVAEQIVVELGIAALTVSAIEQRVPFSRGVIAYHFRNKSDVEHALLDRAIATIDESVREALRAKRDPTERVMAIVPELVRGFLAHHGTAGQVLMAFWGRLRSDPAAAVTNTELYARYRSEAAVLLRAAPLPPDTDADALAGVLVALVIGICTQSFFDDSFDVPSAVAQANRMLGSVIS